MKQTTVQDYKNRAISSVGSEHLVYTERVGGSNPSSPTRKASVKTGAFFIYLTETLLIMKSIKKLLIVLTVLTSCAVNSQTILTHNISNEILQTGMYACNGGELTWARSFVLADFGINQDEDFIISSGDFGMYRVSSWDNYIKFNIYKIDQNFPDTFQTAVLIGSSQVEEVPYFGSSSPIIKTVVFENPVIVPAGTETILVEVEQTGFSNSSHEVFAGLTLHDDAYSWIKSGNPGCPPSSYTDIANLGVYSSDKSFYITVTGTKTIAGVVEFQDVRAYVYPNPSRAILNIETNQHF